VKALAVDFGRTVWPSVQTAGGWVYTTRGAPIIASGRGRHAQDAVVRGVDNVPGSVGDRLRHRRRDARIGVVCISGRITLTDGGLAID
jgi:hypothetical protein